MELKRFDWSKKEERPSCPYQTDRGRCLANCVHLFKDGELSGCALDDKARATVILMEKATSSADAISKLNAELPLGADVSPKPQGDASATETQRPTGKGGKPSKG